jgi:hypothetical protein
LQTVARIGAQVFEFGKEGAQITQTTQSFELMNDEIFKTPDLLERMRDSSRGTISDVGLMQGVLKLTAGASDELGQAFAGAAPRLLEIAKASNKLNPALGDTAFLYDSISTGIKRASPLILDNLGIVVKVGEANKTYAEELGKTVAQLTAEEKQMALLNATLAAGDQLIQQVGGNVDSATDSWAQLEVKVENSTNKLKEFAAGALLPVVEGLVPATDAVTNSYGNMVEEIVAGNLEMAGSMSQLQSEAERIQTALGVAGGLGAVLSGTGAELRAGRAEVARAMEEMSSDVEAFQDNLDRAFGAEAPIVVRELATAMEAPRDVLFSSTEAQIQWIRNQRIANAVAADADKKFKLLAEEIEKAALQQDRLAEGADRKLIGPTDEDIASVEDYKTSVEELIQAEEDQVQATANVRRVLDAHAKAARDDAARQEELAEATEEAAKAAERQARSFRITGGFVDALGGNELAFFNEELDELGPKLITIGGRTADQNRILGEAKDRYENLDRAIVDYQIGLDGLSLSEGERAEKVAELVEQQQELIPLMDELGAVTGTAQMAVQEATVNEEALSQALFDSVGAIAAQNEELGIGATELALMAGALGIYNDAQLEAALKQAILSEKVKEFASAVAEGVIGIEEANRQLLLEAQNLVQADLTPPEVEIDTVQAEEDAKRLADILKPDATEESLPSAPAVDITTDAAEEQIPVDLLASRLTPGAAEGGLPEAVEVDVTTTAPEATGEVDDFIRRLGDIERDIDVSVNVKVNQTGSVNVPFPAWTFPAFNRAAVS